jgi:hypothetical protein
VEEENIRVEGSSVGNMIKDNPSGLFVSADEGASEFNITSAKPATAGTVNSGQPEAQGKDLKGVGNGLRNKGNTCYLNSVLQCLSHTSPFVEQILSNGGRIHRTKCPHYHEEIKKRKWCPMCIMESHVGKTFAANQKPMAPDEIIQSLAIVAKHFEKGTQQDAHEFLVLWLNALREAGCPSTNGKPALLEVFRGQHCSSVKCLECKRESPKDDLFTQLEAYQSE